MCGCTRHWDKGSRCTCICPEHRHIRAMQEATERLRLTPGGTMYFTIERAGLLKRRFRARCFGANDELVWMTQTYADKRDAQKAVDFLQENIGLESIELRDMT